MKICRSSRALFVVAAVFIGCGKVAASQAAERLPAVLPPPADSPRYRRINTTSASRTAAAARPAPAKPASAKQPAPQRENLTEALKAAIRRNVRTGSRPLTIEIEPGPRAIAGTFAGVLVEARPVWVNRTIEISSLWLRARNARFDPDALKAGRLQQLSGQVSARLVITEANMTSLLARHPHTAGMNFRARIDNKSVRITGRSTAGIVRGDVRLVGHITLKQGQIGLQIDSLHVNGVEANSLVKAFAQAQVNAALTVDNVPFRPAFRKVTYAKSEVVVET